MEGMLVGKKAPDFKAQAVVKGAIVDHFSLNEFLGKYVVFFFYPLDFTFVCPTELHAFQEMHNEFEARNAQIIGCSVDSPYSHLAWLETPKQKGGIAGIEYPLVSDLNKTISKNFCVLNEEQGLAFRGLFLIDRQGIVRHQLVNDLAIGRSTDEALRTLDALIAHETYGTVCPANWHKGSKTLEPTQADVAKYLTLQK